MIDLVILQRLYKECFKPNLPFNHSACILDSKNNIISIGYNHILPYKIGDKYTIHAEEDVIMKLPKYYKKNKRYNLTMIVIRKSNDGLIRISKPCQKCVDYINKAKNIKRVIYSFEPFQI